MNKRREVEELRKTIKDRDITIEQLRNKIDNLYRFIDEHDLILEEMDKRR